MYLECVVYRDVGIGLASPVLAGSLFLKVKTKFQFTKSKYRCKIIGCPRT